MRNAQPANASWSSMPLRDACAKPIVYGIVQAGPHVPDGVPYIRSTDVGQPLDPSSLLRTSATIAAKYARSRVASGDIVFSLRGNIGEMSIVPGELDGANLTQGTARLSPASDVCGPFLYYALQAAAVRRILHSIAKGSALREVTLEDLRTVPVLLPPTKALQESIAGVLSKWDAAITAVQLLINATQRRRTVLAEALLMGERRGPRHTSPWKTLCFGEFFEELSVVNTDRRVQLPLSCSKIYGVIPQADRFEKRLASADLGRYQVARRGDLVYDPMLLWDGSIAFVDTVEEGVVSPAYNVFTFRGDESYRSWFRNLFKTPRMKHQFRAISQGTNARRKKAPVDAFLGLSTDLPTEPDEVRALVYILELSEREVFHLKALEKSLTKQKIGLMQKLLVG